MPNPTSIAVKDGNGTLQTVSTLDNVLLSVGATADAAVTNPASAASLVAALKGLLSLLTHGQTTASGSVPVVPASDALAPIQLTFHSIKPLITSGQSNGLECDSRGSLAVIPTFAGNASNTGTGAAGTGTQRVAVSTDSPGGAIGNAAYSILTDGTHAASLFQSHNADNQALGGTVYALNTGGVAQILNAAGNVDRQREVAFDGSSAAGIVAGASNLAVPFSTTLGAAVTATAAPQSVLVASSTNLQVGDIVSIGGANPESTVVTSIADGTHFSAVFANNHSNTDPVKWFHYNVTRDAAIGDQVSIAGLSAGMTYFWNAYTNKAEMERSAAGELDNASGTGTAVAAEYEFNALSFDRGRNLMGKGFTQSTITATTGADTSLTFSADPSLIANGGLKAGAYLLLSTGVPTPLAGDLVQVGSTYVSGTSVPVTPVGVASITAGRTKATFSSFSNMGPGLNGFIPDGIAIEEEAVFDPVSGLYFLERAATQDGVSGQNVVMESLALFNGATFDRAVNGHGTAAKALRVELPTDGTGQVNAIPVPAATGGWTASRVKAAATTNATSVKGSAASLGGYSLFNNASSARYVKLYNSASAPTAGSGTPFFTIILPANGGANVEFVHGVALNTGLGYTITAGVADTDTTATSADDVHGALYYK